MNGLSDGYEDGSIVNRLHFHNKKAMNNITRIMEVLRTDPSPKSLRVQRHLQMQYQELLEKHILYSSHLKWAAIIQMHEFTM